MKPSRPYVPLLLCFGLAWFASGCSKTEEPAVVTLPEHASTTTVPQTLAPPPSSADQAAAAPPKIEWVAQVGGAGDDVFNGITGSAAEPNGPSLPDQPSPDSTAPGDAPGSTQPDSGSAGTQSDDLVAVGSTNGGLTAPTVGAEDVLSVRVAADGKVRSSDVSGSASTDVATSVTTVHTSGGAVGSLPTAPLACGYTTGDYAGVPQGLIDGWCGLFASAAPSDGKAGGKPFGTSVTTFAADANEVINGVAATDPDDNPSLAADQNIFVAGSTDGLYPGAGDSTGRGLGQGDALAFRTSLTHGTSWIRQFGTPKPDSATAVCTVDGNGYFVGWTDGDLGARSNGGRDAWISMIDRAGMQRWLTQFGYAANEEFRSVAVGGRAAEGSQQFVAVGLTDGDGPQPSNGAKDALIAAFAPDGSTLWAKQLGSKLDDDAASVAIYDSVIYVAGTTTSAAASEASPAVEGLGTLDDSIGPGGAKDAFLTAIDAKSGSVLWTTRFGSAADEVVTSMTVTKGGILAIAGSTTGSLGSNSSAGGKDGFVVAYQLPSAAGSAQNWV